MAPPSFCLEIDLGNEQSYFLVSCGAQGLWQGRLMKSQDAPVELWPEMVVCSQGRQTKADFARRLSGQMDSRIPRLGLWRAGKSSASFLCFASPSHVSSLLEDEDLCCEEIVISEPAFTQHAV